MNRVFEGHGVRFEFPDDWILHEQESPEEVSITINSQETSFWSLTLLFDRPDIHEVVEAVINTLQEEYTELDVYPSEARLGDSHTVARDIDFVCHELIGSAFVRAAMAPGFTVLVLFQADDFELEETEIVFEKISNSLTWSSAADGQVRDVLDLFTPLVEPVSDDDAKTDDDLED